MALAAILVFYSWAAQANLLSDMDFDGVPDVDELNIYHTNYLSADTDNDGYSDWTELNTGFSPHNSLPVKLEENDYDNDGLSDRQELDFKTDLSKADSDGDSYTDKEEIEAGYDPLNPDKKLDKLIRIDLKKQELSYYLGDMRLGVYSVSSGANHSTPPGKYRISNKNPKAWSSYGLWMPYWMRLGNTRMGIHELPIWPSGYIEGEDHLGTPVSHGCIRLGKGPAETLYNWAEVGTEVIIY